MTHVQSRLELIENLVSIQNALHNIPGCQKDAIANVIAIVNFISIKQISDAIELWNLINLDKRIQGKIL